MKYATINYSRRTPQAKVQRILTSAVPVPPPPPPPPSVYFLVSGTVTQDGSAPGFITGIEFTSLGTIFTATSGSYGLLVQLGYGGTAIPHYALGDFTPQVRTYGSVVADTPNQDYAFAPYPDLNITGAIRLDGVLLTGAQVNLSGSGVYLSDGAGTYVGTVDYGYSGAGALVGYGLPNYAVSPSSRVYTGLTTNQAGQDYNVTTQIFLVQGTITAAGTGQAISLTNGTSVWSSAASGSYGYNVIGGWSGSTVPSYISVPGSYSYGSVTSNQLAQNFDLPVPLLTFAFPSLDWSTWSYTLPDHWQIQAQNPASFVWTDTGTAAGTDTNSVVTDFGTRYRIYGHSPSHAQITPFSNDVEAAVVIITGEVRLDGNPVLGAAVSFSGDGQGSTDAAGTYFGTLPSGYNGTATLLGYPAPAYAVTPQSRIYVNLTTNQAGQDYDIETQIWSIEGVTTSNGTGIATEITNGIATWNTAADGSYSYLVVGGFSGSTVPTYISDPGSYSYVNVQADFLNQDFDIPAPDLTYAPTDLSWIGWAYTNPAYWRVEVSATGSTAWTFYNYTAGTSSSYPVAESVGSYFRIFGVNSGSNQITPPSNVVFAEPPDPGSFLISGALTDDGSPMVGIGVEVTSFGTVVTNGAGTYSQIVGGGYNGTVIPHYTGGSFVPEYRVYTNVLSPQLNQDYVFYGTETPADCPVVSTLAVIPINTDPKNPSRNVIDPVNNLLWVIDETYSNVYYIDVVAGTHLGTLDLGFGVGSPGIVYDSVNQKVVVSSYSGSLAFINPVTKAVTYSNFTQTTPAIHCLAVDQAGTIYVADAADAVTGNVYVVNGASEQLTATYPLGPDSIFTQSICWAENINRLVINNSVAFSTLFYLLDTSNGNFSASVASAGSFAYTESYYVFATGDVLMGANNATTVAVIDISLGTNGTASMQLPADFDNGAPLRVGDATEDTCANTLFVSDAEYAVWEYTMDGNYTLLNCYANGYLGLNQIGLAHSRATNQVYYENSVDGTTYSVPYAQYLISGTVTEGGIGLANVDMEFTTFGTATFTDSSGSYYLMVPVEWSGTVIPHYPAGTFAPASRVYTNVGTDYPNQDYEYFWGGYLFLTEGVTGFVWPSLPNDAIVVDNGGTIVQLHGDNFVYTSTVGRSDWTLRGFAQDGVSIAYGAGPDRYVVVGSAGAIWTAEDLSVWYSRVSNVGANALTSVAYGNDRYVAVGETGVTTMSTDGTTWAASTAGTLQFSDVYYNGTVFVAVGVENQGQVTCYTSTHGTTWTLQNTPAYSWRDGAYSPELGLNVIIGEGGALATSTDAVTWTDYTGAIVTIEYLAGIAWGNNRFVITDGQGFVWTSSNGTVWDYVTDDPFFRIGRGAAYWKNDWFIITENFPPT